MLKNFFSQPLFKDARATLLVVAGFLLMLVHTIDFTLNIQQQEIKIPIRYSGYNESLSDKGSWVSLLVLLVFGIVVFVINTAISIKVYNVRRTLAIMLLSLNVVVMVFLILVSRALLNLV